MTREVGETRGPTDPDTTVLAGGHIPGAGDARQIDDGVGAGDLFANAHDEIGAAPEWHRSRDRETLVCVLDGRCPTERERMYHLR
jgi:hypothetical protein